MEKLDIENIELTANVEQCEEIIQTNKQFIESLNEKLNDTSNEKEGLCSKLAESIVEKQSITKKLSEINDYNSKIKQELANKQSDCKVFKNRGQIDFSSRDCCNQI
jgi:predicted nuclease with TOPRIM domain